MSAYLTYRLRGPDRTIFLPGGTTDGHYQIEMACEACHTPLLGVKEEACVACHGADLKAANDSHPKSKFADPRNASRLEKLDALHCLTCHREHVPAQTRAMGVTLPDDYCYHCHQDIATDRPSHRDFSFNSCNTAGCHNYHDNTALYEDFLLKQAEAPAPPGHVKVRLSSPPSAISLKAKEQNAPEGMSFDPQIAAHWEESAHARGGVQCGACHFKNTAIGPDPEWAGHVDHRSCQKCHAQEVSGFLGGRHGMRLAQGLSPMRPALARLPMKTAAAQRELTCVACHPAHQFDTKTAAVESCLNCHDDSHSLAYSASPHAALWRRELAGQGQPGTGVNCATCHLPRHASAEEGRVVVQHNQNDNLRPNEKMTRGVCLQCHDLAFSIDAMADPALIRANFNGAPARHIETIDLAQRRQSTHQKSKL